MFSHLSKSHRTILRAGTAIGASLLVSCSLALAPRLAHADVAHVGTALVSTSPGESVEIGETTYVKRAPRVLRPSGGTGSRYVATPDYARRLPAHACVTQPLRVAYATSDVAVVTDGGVQLAQRRTVIQRTGVDGWGFANVVNGAPSTRTVATYDGRTFCNGSSVAMWAMAWRG